MPSTWSDEYSEDESEEEIANSVMTFTEKYESGRESSD